MLKAVVAVVVGYLVMAVAVFLGLAAAAMIMGVDRAYQPASYDPSMLWLAVSFLIGFIAAIIGGIVCAVVTTRGSKAPAVLAALTLVLGLVVAVWGFMTPRPAPEPRGPDVTLAQAMPKSRTPTFVAFLNAFIGGAGVLLGARLRGRPAPGPAPGGG